MKVLAFFVVAICALEIAPDQQSPQTTEVQKLRAIHTASDGIAYFEIHNTDSTSEFSMGLTRMLWNLRELTAPFETTLTMDASARNEMLKWQGVIDGDTTWDSNAKFNGDVTIEGDFYLQQDSVDAPASDVWPGILNHVFERICADSAVVSRLVEFTDLTVNNIAALTNVQAESWTVGDLETQGIVLQDFVGDASATFETVDVSGQAQLGDLTQSSGSVTLGDFDLGSLELESATIEQVTAEGVVEADSATFDSFQADNAAALNCSMNPTAEFGDLAVRVWDNRGAAPCDDINLLEGETITVAGRTRVFIDMYNDDMTMSDDFRVVGTTDFDAEATLRVKNVYNSDPGSIANIGLMGLMIAGNIEKGMGEAAWSIHDTTIEPSLTILGDAHFGGSLDTTSTADVDGKSAIGTANTPANLNVNGGTGTSVINTATTVNGNIEFNSKSGATTIEERLEVVKTSMFMQDVNIVGNAEIGENVVDKDMTVTGNGDFTHPKGDGVYTSVAGDATVGGNVVVDPLCEGTYAGAFAGSDLVVSECMRYWATELGDGTNGTAADTFTVGGDASFSLPTMIAAEEDADGGLRITTGVFMVTSTNGMNFFDGGINTTNLETRNMDVNVFMTTTLVSDSGNNDFNGDITFDGDVDFAAVDTIMFNSDNNTFTENVNATNWDGGPNSNVLIRGEGEFENTYSELVVNSGEITSSNFFGTANLTVLASIKLATVEVKGDITGLGGNRPLTIEGNVNVTGSTSVDQAVFYVDYQGQELNVMGEMFVDDGSGDCTQSPTSVMGNINLDDDADFVGEKIIESLSAGNTFESLRGLEDSSAGDVTFNGDSVVATTTTAYGTLTATNVHTASQETNEIYRLRVTDQWMIGNSSVPGMLDTRHHEQVDSTVDQPVSAEFGSGDSPTLTISELNPGDKFIVSLNTESTEIGNDGQNYRFESNIFINGSDNTAASVTNGGIYCDTCTTSTTFNHMFSGGCVGQFAGTCDSAVFPAGGGTWPGVTSGGDTSALFEWATTLGPCNDDSNHTFAIQPWYHVDQTEHGDRDSSIYWLDTDGTTTDHIIGMESAPGMLTGNVGTFWLGQVTITNSVLTSQDGSSLEITRDRTNLSGGTSTANLGTNLLAPMAKSGTEFFTDNGKQVEFVWGTEREVGFDIALNQLPDLVDGATSIDHQDALTMLDSVSGNGVQPDTHGAYQLSYTGTVADPNAVQHFLSTRQDYNTDQFFVRASHSTVGTDTPNHRNMFSGIVEGGSVDGVFVMGHLQVVANEGLAEDFNRGFNRITGGVRQSYGEDDFGSASTGSFNDASRELFAVCTRGSSRDLWTDSASNTMPTNTYGGAGTRTEFLTATQCSDENLALAAWVSPAVATTGIKDDGSSDPIIDTRADMVVSMVFAAPVHIGAVNNFMHTPTREQYVIAATDGVISQYDLGAITTSTFVPTHAYFPGIFFESSTLLAPHYQINVGSPIVAGQTLTIFGYERERMGGAGTKQILTSLLFNHQGSGFTAFPSDGANPMLLENYDRLLDQQISLWSSALSLANTPTIRDSAWSANSDMNFNNNVPTFGTSSIYTVSSDMVCMSPNALKTMLGHDNSLLTSAQTMPIGGSAGDYYVSANSGGTAQRPTQITTGQDIFAVTLVGVGTASWFVQEFSVIDIGHVGGIPSTAPADNWAPAFLPVQTSADPTEISHGFSLRTCAANHSPVGDLAANNGPTSGGKWTNSFTAGNPIDLGLGAP